MRLILILSLSLVWLVAAGVFAYQFWPRETVVLKQRRVPLTSYRIEKAEIEIGDQKGFVSLRVKDDRMRFERYNEIRTPTRDELLRFAFMCGIGTLLGLYFLNVLLLASRYQWSGTTLPKGIEKQLTASTTFLMGLLSGFLLIPPAPAASDSANVPQTVQVETAPLRADIAYSRANED